MIIVSAFQRFIQNEIEDAWPKHPDILEAAFIGKQMRRRAKSLRILLNCKNAINKTMLLVIAE